MQKWHTNTCHFYAWAHHMHDSQRKDDVYTQTYIEVICILVIYMSLGSVYLSEL